MEPLSAVGLSGNVIQLVDFVCKLVQETRTVYKSASGLVGNGNSVLQEITIDINRLAGAIVVSPGHSDELRRLAAKAQAVSQDILAALQKLTVDGKKTRWKSFRVALSAVWTQNKVDEMRVALSEIFTNMLQDPSLESAYMIIDALDECEVDLQKLLEFIVNISATISRVKWIVSSRNWPSIERGLQEAAQKTRLSLELNEKSVSAAVDIYVRCKVDELAMRNKYDRNTQEKVRHYLSSNASGTFLWVALVCQQLVGLSGWKAQKKVTTFPPGLDNLYERMLKQIIKSDDADLCKSIMAVMPVVCRPITLDELTSFVDMPEEASADYEALAEIIGFCGSFLTLREYTISLIHQSAKDFLLGKAFSKIFPSGIEDIHYAIFSRSLRVMNNTLRRNIYSLGAPGSFIDDTKPPDPDPLAATRYACVYWVDHLWEWQSSNNFKRPDIFQDGGIIDDFLKQHYLHWLEALSLCRSMSQGIFSMAKLDSILQISSTRRCHRNIKQL